MKNCCKQAKAEAQRDLIEKYGLTNDEFNWIDGFCQRHMKVQWRKTSVYRKLKALKKKVNG